MTGSQINANEFEDEFVKTSSGEVLLLGEQIGGGAEGYVYHVQEIRHPSGSSDTDIQDVAKIFRYNKLEEVDLEPKIKTMVENPPRDPTKEKEGFPSIIWPTELLTHGQNGRFVGYRMDYLDIDSRKDPLKYACTDQEWEHSSLKKRIQVALNMAVVVSMIHEQDHAIGDLNEQNFYVKDGYITAIDCDAYHIKGSSDGYTGSTVYERYAPPEGRGSNLEQVKYSDRFGLGVHIFQFLMEGYHPFQAVGSSAVDGSVKSSIENNQFPYHDPQDEILEPIPRAPDYHSLPKEIQVLFKKCFVEGKRTPEERPNAWSWVQVLAELYQIEKYNNNSRNHSDIIQSVTTTSKEKTTSPENGSEKVNSMSDGPSKSLSGVLSNDSQVLSAQSSDIQESINPSSASKRKTTAHSSTTSTQSNDDDQKLFSRILSMELLFLGPGMILIQLFSLFIVPSVFYPTIAILSAGMSLRYTSSDFLKPFGRVTFYFVVPVLFWLGLLLHSPTEPFIPPLVVAYCGLTTIAAVTTMM